MKNQWIPLTTSRPKRRFEVPADADHDSCHLRQKYVSPSVCMHCLAVYQTGRWMWGIAPASADKTMCPACRRLRDQEPAGYIFLAGDLAPLEREDLLRLVRELATREMHEHPLRRLMRIQDCGGQVRITTTSVHLAQAIGNAVIDKLGGEVAYSFKPEAHRLLVRWKRQPETLA